MLFIAILDLVPFSNSKNVFLPMMANCNFFGVLSAITRAKFSSTKNLAKTTFEAKQANYIFMFYYVG